MAVHVSKAVVGHSATWVLTIGKSDSQLKLAAMPYSLFLSRDAALPVLHVDNAILSSKGLCDKAKGVIAPPLLAAPVLAESVYCFIEA